MSKFNLNPQPESPKVLNLQKCLCHRDGINENLSNFTEVSWATFRDAAKIRKDHNYTMLKDLWEYTKDRVIKAMQIKLPR